MMRGRLLVWALCGAFALFAVTNGMVRPQPPASEPPSLAALRAENEALRRENQMLRRELVAKKGAAAEALLPTKVVDRGEAFTPPAEDTGFWLSAKSKIRHNPRCRNYRKVRGRPCGPNDGKPCKTCGG